MIVRAMQGPHREKNHVKMIKTIAKREKNQKQVHKFLY